MHNSYHIHWSWWAIIHWLWWGPCNYLKAWAIIHGSWWWPSPRPSNNLVQLLRPYNYLELQTIHWSWWWVCQDNPIIFPNGNSNSEIVKKHENNTWKYSRNKNKGIRFTVLWIWAFIFVSWTLSCTVLSLFSFSKIIV